MHSIHHHFLFNRFFYDEFFFHSNFFHIPRSKKLFHAISKWKAKLDVILMDTFGAFFINFNKTERIFAQLLFSRTPNLAAHFWPLVCYCQSFSLFQEWNVRWSLTGYVTQFGKIIINLSDSSYNNSIVLNKHHSLAFPLSRRWVICWDELKERETRSQ